MRQVAVLVAVLFVALAFNSILPKPSAEELDRSTVEKFIVEDAKDHYGEYASYKVVKSEKAGEKWLIDLDITLTSSSAPGIPSTCTRTFRRYYSLFPIVFREELYADNC